ncbi:MAG TPA: alpha/beta fold hydrolase [Pyrinomonadaceae bacterium]|jgi:pimeloyl-ACP methyl ester carboxylesterase|nr:alpha/beta fold hydrolase [Pyrinomonadaceae bacterium]
MPENFRAATRRVALVLCATLCASVVVGAKSVKRESGFAEVNGARLYYEAMGEGPAVVLVHGGLVDSRLWDAQMKPLSKHFRVVRYDLRGFGRSAAATVSFSPLEDLRALLDFLKIEKASLVGLSLGGIIAADFALEHPERVERLVLVGAGLRGDKQPPPADAAKASEAINHGAEAFADATMARGLYKAVRPRTTAYTRLRRMLLDNFAAPAARRSGSVEYPEPPTAERLAQIKQPTLVVIGGEDAPNLKNIADTLASKIPNARKVTIPGSSHHPPVETPKEFNRVLLDYLKGREP